jgi:uncharacterized membrane protein YvbJ
MAKLNYCPNCGEPVKENYTVCPACGESLQDTQNLEETDRFEQNISRSNQQNFQPTPPEENTFGWAVLGFLIPVVGLVLYLVWQTERPQVAKSAGTGALTSVVISILAVMFLASMAGAAA